MLIEHLYFQIGINAVMSNRMVPSATGTNVRERDDAELVTDGSNQLGRKYYGSAISDVCDHKHMTSIAAYGVANTNQGNVQQQDCANQGMCPFPSVPSQLTGSAGSSITDKPTAAGYIGRGTTLTNMYRDISTNDKYSIEMSPETVSQTNCAENEDVAHSKSSDENSYPRRSSSRMDESYSGVNDVSVIPDIALNSETRRHIEAKTNRTSFIRPDIPITASMFAQEREFSKSIYSNVEGQAASNITPTPSDPFNKGTLSSASSEQDSPGSSRDYSMPLHLRQHILPKKPHTCSYCEKGFSELNFLNVHILISHPDKKQPENKPIEEFIIKHDEPITTMTYATPKSLKCIICSKSFIRKDGLRRHMLMHGAERAHTCSICTKAFSHVVILKRHMLTHSDIKRYVCSVCDKTFTYKISLVSHMSRHTGEKPHPCTICGKGFNRPSGLKVHMYLHSEQKPLSCMICSKGFTTTGDLNKHMLYHSGIKPYTCKECGRSFSSSSGVKSHMRQHTGEKPHTCTICERAFTHSVSLKAHMSTHTGYIPHVCSTCGRKFSHESSLRRHMVIHTGERRFGCDECGKYFARRSDLKIHKIIHDGYKPKQCEVCGKGVRHLAKHLLTHTGARPYQCPTCGKNFTQTSHIKRHMLTHTKGSAYPCTECNKSFSNPNSLKVHFTIHTGDSPFKCTICARVFAKGSALARHTKTHDRVRVPRTTLSKGPARCEVCSKVLSRASDLKTHMMIHTGEKPFPCEMCDKRFTRQRDRKMHMMTHTGEKPHHCRICGKGYTRGDLLRKHEQGHSQNMQASYHPTMYP